MGRIDLNVHPDSANRPASGYGYTNSDAGTFTGKNNALGHNIALDFPDRYVGEHSDVYNIGSDHSLGTIPTSGVVYCNPTNCACNVHVKGIVSGQVTM
jgi:hypothetical protein